MAAMSSGRAMKEHGGPSRPPMLIGSGAAGHRTVAVLRAILADRAEVDRVVVCDAGRMLHHAHGVAGLVGAGAEAVA
jgi:hypothetical protein